MNLIRVSKDNPCPHCGKPDWCYFLGELSVCNRNHEPAQGWYKTTKTDSKGKFYYAPEQPKKKKVRPKQTRYWKYPSRDGSPLIQVVRIDDGEGGKPTRWQEHWNGKRWLKGYGNIQRADIPIYRYEEVRKAIADHKLIFIVEGEPCADALWELGLAATTNIGGADSWRDSDTADLLGEEVILCPDRDKQGLKHMEKIAKDFPNAKWLYAYPESPFWEVGRIPESKGLDIADWIEDYQLTSSDILKSIEPRRNFDSQPDQKPDEPEELKFNSRLNQKLHQIESRLGNHLNYNEFKKWIEIDHKPICDEINNQGGAKLFIAETLDMDISDSDAISILNRIAKKHPYHPVRDYLEECYTRYGTDTTILENIALRYFGATEPIHQTYLIKHLIGSVKRIFEPGCKFDSMLILKGEQGIQKSTWFRVLYGDENFTDSILGTEEKDSLMALSQYWACEYSEFESITTKKDVSQFKSWLGRGSDDYRAPYARTVKSHPRTFVLVGSTNRDDFLRDETGNRRFMVIPVQGDIPTELLLEERDRIWGAAVSLYRADFSSFLSKKEMAVQKIINEDFTQVDPWQDAIAKYLQDRTQEFVPTTKILEDAIGLDTAQMDQQANRRAAAVMQVLGWKRQRKRFNGCQPWGWVLPVPAEDNKIADDLAQVVTLVQQELETTVPDVPEQNSKEDPVATFIGWVRSVIADNDAQTAKHIRVVLQDACTEIPGLRHAVWEALVTEEREAFKRLLETEELNLVEQLGNAVTETVPLTEEQTPVAGTPDLLPGLQTMEPKFKVGDKIISNASGLHGELVKSLGIRKFGGDDRHCYLCKFDDGHTGIVFEGNFVSYVQLSTEDIIDNSEKLKAKAISLQTPDEEIWQMNGFKKGDRVRLKDRTFLKGKHHQWPTGELLNWHNIVDRISFDVELPSREIIRVDAEYLEINTLINSRFPYFNFGSRVKYGNKTGTLIGNKGNSALVLWDNSSQPSECKFSDLSLILPKSDPDSFFRAFGIFNQLGKGSRVQALRHPDHKGTTNKVATVRAKKYEDGKFLVSCEELMVFNLEAVKVIEFKLEAVEVIE